MKTPSTKNRGAALITSLVLMMALTMVSLAAIQTTAMQVQISGNDEATFEADQYAQSVVDAVIETSTNFVIGASNGYTVCAASETGCDATSLTLNDPMFSSVNGGINATTGVQAKVTLVKTGTAPRMAKDASSADKFPAAYFKITGTYDEISNNRGKSTVNQGFILVFPTL